MAPVIEVTQARGTRTRPNGEVVFDIHDLTVSYGRATTAISGVDLDIYRNLITAVIGPSGCGKSTFLRCLNRMNDLVPGAKIDGKILYHGDDIYATGSIRSRCGGGSGWCSRSRIRFPSRSTTTSLGGSACSA